MDLDSTRRFVVSAGISVEFIEHLDFDGQTSVGAALATGEGLTDIIKVLCFVDSKGSKCFVIIQGNKKVDTKKIPGIKKPRLASSAELKSWFDAEPGAIPPVALPTEIPKYVDAGISKLPYVIGSAGSRFVGLKLGPKDIINQPNTTVLDLSQSLNLDPAG